MKPRSIDGALDRSVNAARPPGDDALAQHSSAWRRLLAHEGLNHALTRHVPRVLLTRAVGAWARIESPALTRLTLRVWRAFTDLDLSEAEPPGPQGWRSLREVFVRRLRPGLRPLDTRPEVLASPCDAIVGAGGTVERGMALQAKGMPYRLADLFGSEKAARPWEGGRYLTLRLTSAMYHRFHAPADAVVERVRFMQGDVFNVNPPALARIPRLFCRNERAALTLRLPDGTPLALVPVAAILVASLRLHCIDALLHGRWRGPGRWRPNVPVRRGDEMGWFEHGSTILVFVPPGFDPAPGVHSGARIAVGSALLVDRRLPAPPSGPGAAGPVTEPPSPASTMSP
jgi:phosphatidylserine decarboxylase